MKLTKKQKKINKKERHMKTKSYAKKQIKKQERQKDKEWRKLIMAIYSGKCVICRNTNKPNAHHIIPRNFKEFRWDTKNGILLCPKHHKFGKFSAHKNPLWFLRQLIKYDSEQYNYLIKKLPEENENNI